MGSCRKIIDSKVAFETVGDILMSLWNMTLKYDSNMDSMYVEDQGETNPRNLVIFSDDDEGVQSPQHSI